MDCAPTSAIRPAASSSSWSPPSARAVVEWERLGFEREALWRGTQLAEAARLDLEELPPRERRFLEASHKAQRRARLTRRLAIVAVPVVLALVGGGIWLDTRAELRAKVDARLETGRAALEASRHSASALDQARKQAFALFDAREIEAAERTWSRVLDLRTQVAQDYASAIRELETAFSLDGKRSDVRSLFGDVLLERAYVAEDAGRLLERDELVQRLALFDDSHERRRRGSAPATLAISSKPEAAVEVHRYRSDCRAWVASDREGPSSSSGERTEDGRSPCSPPRAISPRARARSSPTLAGRPRRRRTGCGFPSAASLTRMPAPMRHGWPVADG